MGRRSPTIEGATEKNIGNLWGEGVWTFEPFAGELEEANRMILI